MATGIYWGLVLTGCMSLVLSGKFSKLTVSRVHNTSIAVVQYSQTDPSPGIAPCHGDRVVLNCTTNTGSVVWKLEDGGITGLTNLGQSSLEGRILLAVIAVNGNMITSTATIESVNISQNGTMIGCSGTLGDFTYLHINLAG